MLASEPTSVDEIFVSLRIVIEHAALETVNRLEAAIYAWKERITEQGSSGKSPVRASWLLVRDSLSEIGHVESLKNKAERLNDEIKSKYPNLPQSFLDATKIQYGKVRVIIDISYPVVLLITSYIAVAIASYLQV